MCGNVDGDVVEKMLETPRTMIVNDHDCVHVHVHVSTPA
jgi:hypothetical protein